LNACETYCFCLLPTGVVFVVANDQREAVRIAGLPCVEHSNQCLAVQLWGLEPVPFLVGTFSGSPTLNLGDEAGKGTLLRLVSLLT